MRKNHTFSRKVIKLLRSKAIFLCARTRLVTCNGDIIFGTKSDRVWLYHFCQNVCVISVFWICEFYKQAIKQINILTCANHFVLIIWKSMFKKVMSKIKFSIFQCKIWYTLVRVDDFFVAYHFNYRFDNYGADYFKSRRYDSIPCLSNDSKLWSKVIRLFYVETPETVNRFCNSSGLCYPNEFYRNF